VVPGSCVALCSAGEAVADRVRSSIYSSPKIQVKVMGKFLAPSRAFAKLSQRWCRQREGPSGLPARCASSRSWSRRIEGDGGGRRRSAFHCFPPIATICPDCFEVNPLVARSPGEESPRPRRYLVAAIMSCRYSVTVRRVISTSFSPFSTVPSRGCFCSWSCMASWRTLSGNM